MKRDDQGKFEKMYEVDEQFFNEIDTEEKAYILGFIYADGCNFKSKANQKILKITQLEQDIDILQKIQIAMKSNHILGKEIQENGKEKYILTITSNNISDVLYNKGVVYNKSLVLKFPTFLQTDLLHHFVRGYFDGDGCIWSGKPTLQKYTKRNGEIGDKFSLNTKFTFTGTLDFIVSLQEYLINEIKLSKTKLNFSKSKDSTPKFCTMEYSGRGNIKKLYEYMYENASIYGNRKKEKFENIICADTKKLVFETRLIAGKPETVISSQA